MHLSQLKANPRWFRNGVFITVFLISVACSSGIQSNHSTRWQSPLAIEALPGQQIWKQGVSSFLFGTNDTQEWSNNNIETNTSLQLALQNNHLTLMRTFFFDESQADGHVTTDSEIEIRLKTIENMGMTCLGVLSNIFNVHFNEHVVAFAGNRCRLYEFGNEPDDNGISKTIYVRQWNTVIPLLRRINPQAKFIGPVVAYTPDYMQGFLTGVKASNILPDAISLHWYGCRQLPEDQCLAQASIVGGVVSEVHQLMQKIMGKDLPVGVTAWNFDPGNPPPSYGAEKNFITQFTTRALESMIQARVAFACQFDAASYSGYGHLDMFDIHTNRPKPQYYAIAKLIAKYRFDQFP
jgi:hypothetical protein